MDENKRSAFLKKYAVGLHTDEEHEEFLSWVKVASSEDIEAAMDLYVITSGEDSTRSLPNTQLIARLEQALDAIDTSADDKPVSLWPAFAYRIASIAIVIVVLSTGLYFYSDSSGVQYASVIKSKILSHDIAPGSNVAVLTLADGTEIKLDDISNGDVARQAGIQITKTADGMLVYEALTVSDSRLSANLFNIISTPRGGQYQINLPDGSKVWLNAASSLRYPVTFSGHERLVELSGEAYFSVTSDKKKPFKVQSGKQIVEVFGTEFNINSYTNEPSIKTTLVEGSVKITHTLTNLSKVLVPGQEANTDESGSLELTKGDITQAVAWKRGNFLFNDMDLVNILRQLERWYDIDVNYKDIPQTHYNGNISRNVPLSKVLKMLEVTGHVRFTIDGKTVRVSK